MTRQKEIYKPTPLSETVQLRVRFSETDPLGIVWHGNYIKYFEEGRRLLVGNMVFPIWR